MPWSDIVTVDGKAVVVTEALFAPMVALYVRAAVSDTGVIAAVAQAGPFGTCQVVDSLGHRWDSGEVAAGAQPVGINALPGGQWDVAWMRGPIGATYARVTLDATLRPILAQTPEMQVPSGPTSQGMLDLPLSNHPIFTDTSRTVVCGPVTIGLPTTRWPWTVGQDWYGDRIIAWHEGRKQAYEVSRISTPVPSHVTIEADGTAVVCPGLTDVLVREEQFVPWRLWVQPHPALPVAPSRALWRGLEGGSPKAAGNATWGFVDDRPVLESEPWVSQAWAPLQRRVRWLLFLPHNYSPKEFGYPDVAAYAAATAATAKRLGVPVVVYWDGPTYEGWDWLAWFEAQHLPVLRGVQCYPLAGEALGDTVWRITNILTDHRHYKDLIIRPVYAPLGVEVVFRLQAHLDRLCNSLPHIVGDFGFGRSRRPECFDLWPDFQAYWTALCAATPVPVIPPAPLPPAPPALDPLLMSALTLKRSKFVEGSYAADRGGKLYRLSNGKNLSIQEADGLPRNGGLPANGPSETFFLKGDRAYVEFDDIRYTFLVAD